MKIVRQDLQHSFMGDVERNQSGEQKAQKMATILKLSQSLLVSAERGILSKEQTKKLLEQLTNQTIMIKSLKRSYWLYKHRS